MRNAKISADDRDAAVARIAYTTDLDDFADRDLTIEAIIEREHGQGRPVRPARRDRHPARRDPGHEHLVDPDHAASPRRRSRPEQVIGMHFFNPAPVLKLVELVPSHADRARDRGSGLARFVTDVLGKTPIRAPDQAGFVVNALLIPFILAAIRMRRGRATRVGRGHRHRHGARLCASDGPAAAGRPDRPGHGQGDRRRDVRGVQGAALRAAPLCCCGWSTPGCSARRPVAASTPTSRLTAPCTAIGASRC